MRPPPCSGLPPRSREGFIWGASAPKANSTGSCPLCFIPIWEKRREAFPILNPVVPVRALLRLGDCVVWRRACDGLGEHVDQDIVRHHRRRGVAERTGIAVGAQRLRRLG